MQRHVGDQHADKVNAFRIAFGQCIRRDRSHIDCPVSLWRNRYSITEKGQLLVRVHRGRRGLGARTRIFWGYANPQVPDAPRPATDPEAAADLSGVRSGAAVPAVIAAGVTPPA